MYYKDGQVITLLNKNVFATASRKWEEDDCKKTTCTLENIERTHAGLVNSPEDRAQNLVSAIEHKKVSGII